MAKNRYFRINQYVRTEPHADSVTLIGPKNKRMTISQDDYDLISRLDGRTDPLTLAPGAGEAAIKEFLKILKEDDFVVPPPRRVREWFSHGCSIGYPRVSGRLSALCLVWNCAVRYACLPMLAAGIYLTLANNDISAVASPTHPLLDHFICLLLLFAEMFLIPILGLFSAAAAHKAPVEELDISLLLPFSIAYALTDGRRRIDKLRIHCANAECLIFFAGAKLLISRLTGGSRVLLISSALSLIYLAVIIGFDDICDGGQIFADLTDIDTEVPFFFYFSAHEVIYDLRSNPRSEGVKGCYKTAFKIIFNILRLTPLLLIIVSLISEFYIDI